MTKYRYLSSREQFEMTLYFWLGVQQFRKLVFLLEKVIHLKDKKTNINYHVAGFTPSAVTAFKKYLFYNGSIHVRNIIYVVVYAVLRWIFGYRIFFLDYLVFAHLIKDIYCVMLQRYNFLYIKNFQLSQETKRRQRVSKQREFLREKFEKNYMRSNKEHDLRVLLRLKQQLKQNEIIIINQEVAETLYRLDRATKTEV